LPAGLFQLMPVGFVGFVKGFFYSGFMGIGMKKMYNGDIFSVTHDIG
jgi:hypothetical protein